MAAVQTYNARPGFCMKKADNTMNNYVILEEPKNLQDYLKIKVSACLAGVPPSFLINQKKIFF